MSGTDVFTGEFYKTFREEIILIVYSFFQEIKANEILSNSFYETNIIIVAKPGKDIRRKEHYRYLS